MSKKYLIVVDMQNDFITGSLGTDEAKKILPYAVQKVKDFSGEIIFTKDTHYEDYLSTKEGKVLPVAHCIFNTEGWQLSDELAEIQTKHNHKIYIKNTFGSLELAKGLQKEHEHSAIESIELIGLCTDICVVSNAILLKAHLPEVSILVDPNGCAGVNPQKHQSALETMKSCQIEINESGKAV